MTRRLPSRTAAQRKRAAGELPPGALPGSRSAEVVLDVDVEHDRVHLVLTNCGNAVATNVEVAFSRALIGADGSLRLSELPVFARLGVLRPGRTLRIFWDATSAFLGNPDQTAPFTATVSWTEHDRPRQRAQYHHDLSIYAQWPTCLDSQHSQRV